MRRSCTAVLVAVLVGACADPSDERVAVPVTTGPLATTTTSPTTTMATTTTTTTTTTVVEPTPAEVLAAELTATERGTRDQSTTAEQRTEFGVRQQRAYRALADHPELDDIVISLVPDDVRPGVQSAVDARRAVVAHAATRPPSDPPTTLPAWEIVDPLPAETLRGWYSEAELATGVPWAYLAAIHFVETRFGRLVGISPDGAVGPMQFLPSTWGECCAGSITDPRDAIMGAAEYLRSNGAPGDLRAAVHAYNPNNGYVGAVTAYAEQLLADESSLAGYHAWEVYVGTDLGSVRLPVGYRRTEPIAAATYLAEHPEDLETALVTLLG